jgi:hypothetical protein
MLPYIRSLVAIAFILLGCHPSADSPATCGLNDDGGALDVSGRVDGLYGIVDGRVDRAPLAHFDRMARTGSGVGLKDGKKWVGLHMEGDEARAFQEFTASPPGRGVVGVVGGAVVFRHKIRVALTSGDVQVSCCNPQYCDRWETLVPVRRDAG